MQRPIDPAVQFHPVRIGILHVHVVTKALRSGSIHGARRVLHRFAEAHSPTLPYFCPDMLKQGLFQKLQQKLSPQQIQLMKLLQVPTVELEQRIKQEIEENPALEEGEDHDEEDMPTEEQAIADKRGDERATRRTNATIST